MLLSLEELKICNYESILEVSAVSAVTFNHSAAALDFKRLQNHSLKVTRNTFHGK